MKNGKKITTKGITMIINQLYALQFQRDLRSERSTPWKSDHGFPPLPQLPLGPMQVT